VVHLPVPAEADACDLFERPAPTELLGRFLAVAAHDRVDIPELKQQTLRIFRGVAAAHEREEIGRCGANLLPQELRVAVPVDGEAKEVRLWPEEIAGSPFLLAKIDQIDAIRIGLEDDRDVLQAERRKEARAVEFAAVGVDAQNVPKRARLLCSCIDHRHEIHILPDGINRSFRTIRSATALIL